MGWRIILHPKCIRKKENKNEKQQKKFYERHIWYTSNVELLYSYKKNINII